MSNEKYSGLVQHSKDTNEFVRLCLKEAMVQLAKTTDFKSITVTMLCQKAGVSRMAFYRNYNITNDVLYELAVDLNQIVISAVGSPFRNYTNENWYIKAFQLVETYKDTISLMFQENFQGQWMKTVNALALHDESFSAEKKYQRLMWCGGFENAVAHWLRSGLKETPEEMANYCLKYLPNIE